VGIGVADGDGVTDGVGVTLGVGVIDGVGVTLGVGVIDGLGEIVAVGLGVGVICECATVASRSAPKATSVRRIIPGNVPQNHCDSNPA
jgi:hypothetical protein